MLEFLFWLFGTVIYGTNYLCLALKYVVWKIFRHFKKYASLFLEFLPQLLFLILLFLYMVTLMFLKWILYSATNEGTREVKYLTNEYNWETESAYPKLIKFVFFAYRHEIQAGVCAFCFNHFHKYDAV